MWSRQGRELFYRWGDKLMAVEMRPGSRWSRPVALFESAAFGGMQWISYDVSLDNRRFLMAQHQPFSIRQIYVVVNWFEELKRRVQPGKK